MIKFKNLSNINDKHLLEPKIKQNLFLKIFKNVLKRFYVTITFINILKTEKNKIKNIFQGKTTNSHLISVFKRCQHFQRRIFGVEFLSGSFDSEFSIFRNSKNIEMRSFSKLDL